MPWNKDLSGTQKDDLRKARELQKKQSDMLAQQEREMNQQKKKLNARQIAMLRARFGTAGGSNTAGMLSPGQPPQGMSDTASSLFARITGR